jgi:UPF0176 protein
MANPPTPLRVTALYRFARFEDPAALRAPLAELCEANHIKGTLLLAREGINGTIAGTPEAIERALAHIRTLPGCADLEVKDSSADTMPFHRMKVRLKREIVTMGETDVNPLEGVGHYVPPAEWNALIEQPDTILIDTRTDYEVKIGSFTGAIDPHTQSFRDFPAWFRANRETLLEGTTQPKIAMFCTGGIRCEKATAFLQAEGLDEVYHLQGGILKYLEEVPEAQSRWEGECFVFDERVAVTHGLGAGTHALCRGCRMPVSPEDRASPLYEEGVSCPACHASRNETQRAGYAERHRQALLARARGKNHIGATSPDTAIKD